MTHDPDPNITMPQGTEGDGFVMWFDGMPVTPASTKETAIPIEQHDAICERMQFAQREPVA